MDAKREWARAVFLRHDIINEFDDVSDVARCVGGWRWRGPGWPGASAWALGCHRRAPQLAPQQPALPGALPSHQQPLPSTTATLTHTCTPNTHRYYKVKATPSFIFFDQGAVAKRLQLRDVRIIAGNKEDLAQVGSLLLC
jgi:hypothetical protein